MLICPRILLAAAAAGFVACSPGIADAVSCTPFVSKPIVVVTPQQRRAAVSKARPPLTNPQFDWPDTPLGVVKTASGYEFFASDGNYHGVQHWHGNAYGNDKYGSIVTSAGALDNPLGSAAPFDVSISQNPDLSVNPNYSAYTYMGGGPVYHVPAGYPGAGNLLATYHAELPNDPLYAVLGLAASMDDGRHWTDLGEIVRLNQAYAPGLGGFEIGDGPLVLAPDGRYFYLYFPDWIANGSRNPANTTHVSVARAPVAAVLDAAFGTAPHHTVPFEKFYDGRWDLQPAIGGASDDLESSSSLQGYIDVHYDSALGQYVMIISNDTTFGFAESVDAITWSTPVSIGTFGPIAAYPTAVGLGDDPTVLGASFHVFYTYLPTSGWSQGSVKRITITCE